MAREADASTAAPAPRPEPPEAGWQAVLGGLLVDSLQWTLGLFCAFLGAFLLVAPHQFAIAPYAGFLSNPSGWGLVALVCGAAMLSIPTIRPQRQVRAAVHGAVGLVLLLLAAGFWVTGAYTGAIVYTLLGLGTLLAPARPRGWRPPPGRRAGLRSAPPRGDLLCLVLGLSCTINGALMLLAPGLFEQSAYQPGRRWLSLLGALFLATGPPLVLAQLQRLPSRFAPLAHVAAGLALLVFGLVVSVPGRIWTGVAIYCGGGLAVAALPLLRRRFARADPSALRTRLALALALTASVALILAVAVVTSQEERLAEAQVVAAQESEARAVAQNVGDYLESNLARLAALAVRAAGQPLTREAQQDLLDRAAPLYPDVEAFAVVHRSGLVLARSRGFPLSPAGARALAAEGRQDAAVLRFLHVAERRMVLVNAPLARQAGEPAGGPAGDEVKGVLVAVLDAESLHRRLVRPDSRVHLADGQGRAIAVLDRLSAHTLAQRTEGPLPLGWDRDVAAGRTPPPAGRLAGYARVPGFSWAVAVERERSAALAGVRRGRNLAFLLLLILVGLAVAAGVVIGRRIARPLGALSTAIAEMTAGDPAGALGGAAPLPESRITELARLSAAFRDLRARLAERTAESERLADELRARAAALAEADRRKDEFLAMLAHELRNPLGAIANASYVLEERGLTPASADRAVGVIQRQIHHLVRMVDDLLDVSRITRGKVELRRERLDLSDVVRQAVEATRPAIEARRHRLEVRLPPEPVVLEADRTRLEQVVSNLLRNAAKFTEPGGRIEVAVRQDGGEAEVTVRDNGAGIEPELLPRIFDLFTQGEQALDRSGAGLGIGLTLVHRLVELHGGRVEARSEGPGRGAELTVTLPTSGR